MEILEALVSGGSVAGAAIGAALGFIEKPVAKYMEIKAQKEENRHIERMQEAQHAHDKIMAEQELFVEEVRADAALMEASFKHDSSYGETSKWVNNVRALVRPISLPILLGAAMYNPMFMQGFMLALTWFFASRVRLEYPK